MRDILEPVWQLTFENLTFSSMKSLTERHLAKKAGLSEKKKS